MYKKTDLLLNIVLHLTKTEFNCRIMSNWILEISVESFGCPPPPCLHNVKNEIKETHSTRDMLIYFKTYLWNLSLGSPLVSEKKYKSRLNLAKAVLSLIFVCIQPHGHSATCPLVKVYFFTSTQSIKLNPSPCCWQLSLTTYSKEDSILYLLQMFKFSCYCNWVFDSCHWSGFLC